MKAQKHLNESRKANNGQMMTIVAYRHTYDIDIQFEDGTLVEHRGYKDFLTGEIRNPNIHPATYAAKRQDLKKSRVGETNVNNKGIKMEIIKYENAHDVDVRFENGIVLLKKNYSNFKSGDVRCPTIFPNGIRIIEFAYRKGDDWYYICKHDDWPEERILPVKEICPEPISTSKNKSERREIYGSLVNQTTTASNGMKMTCVADNGSKDITVRFEDGAIREHQRRESFLAGHVRHPSVKPRESKKSIKNHIGEVYYDRKGRKMTIVEYFSNSNITIEYEDGTRLENKEYRIVKKGADIYPTTRVGESKIARNGLKMTIIDDSIWHDVHIEFEDGTIVAGCTHAQFDSGAIKHPKYNAKSSKHAKERLHAKLRMKNGLMAEVIEYRSATNIDILFENGLLVLYRDWSSFENQKIGMPRRIGGIHIKEFAYRIGDDWYYIVEKDDWEEDKIMSVKEIYAHEGS